MHFAGCCLYISISQSRVIHGEQMWGDAHGMMHVCAAAVVLLVTVFGVSTPQ